VSQYNLNKLFCPESVAVIGASERPGSVGHTIMENLLAAQYTGKIFPVNLKHKQILGLDAFPSVLAIGAPVDLAVVCSPMAFVPGVIEECAAAGVGGAVIISAGGKEVGAQGAEIEEKIRLAARKGKVRLVGPNCMGLSCGAVNLNASFFHAMPLRGRVAFAAQSGAMCSTVLDYGLDEHIGFSHFVSVGSMIDVDFADLIDYFGSDPEVSSIILYIEGLSATRKFLSAARAVSRVKPIIVLKSGRSEAGAIAAQSHTGALAGEDLVYDAAFKRAGIIRVEMLEDLFSCSDLLAKQTLPKGPNMAIITCAGGMGVMAADYLANYDIRPARLKPETLAALDQYCPPMWSRGNPIDFTGAMKFEDVPKLIDICVRAEEVDAVSVIFIPNGLLPPEKFGEILIANKTVTEKPTFILLPGGEQAKPARALLGRNGFPTFATPEAAMRSFYYLYEYQRSLKMLTEIPEPTTSSIEVDKERAKSLIMDVLGADRRLMTEYEAKLLLAAYGIPVNETFVAKDKIEAVLLARKIDYPVAAKIHSLKITHKSDIGGVQLDLRNADDVIDAFDEIEKAVTVHGSADDFSGITIQKMVKEKGYEVILGSKFDPDFGPVMVFGMGGVMTEIFKDRAVGLPPLNRLLARRMMEPTKVYHLLEGFRGRPAANVPLLEQVLIRLSRLVSDFPEIQELDINPFLIGVEDGFALDARVVVDFPSRPAPWHMALSTYPEGYEVTIETGKGEPLLIRPVRPEDAPGLAAFFNALSDKSRTGKILQANTFNERFIARLTQIDYDRDMVLVAVIPQEGETEVVGVARYFGDPDVIEAEMLITIADSWRGQGVGAALVKLILKAARKRGIKRVWGIISSANRGIISLMDGQGKMNLIPLEGGRELKLIIDIERYFKKAGSGETKE
jgi:acetyltransferase